MLLGLRTVIYTAPDLARAKAGQSELLGSAAPYADAELQPTVQRIRAARVALRRPSAVR